MTETRDIKILPLSQLTDDELKQLLDDKMTQFNALGEHMHIEPDRIAIRLRDEIEEAEAELRDRRDIRMQESMITVSKSLLKANEQMVDVNRSTLKVYKALVWLTVVLAAGTLGQVVVAIYQAWPKR